MTKRIIYNVVPRNGEWHVVKENRSEAHFHSKSDAVDFGRNLAQCEESAELRVIKLDGSIQSESLFGRDPLEVEG